MRSALPLCAKRVDMTLALYVVILAAFSVTFTLEVVAPASGAHCDKRWQIYAGFLSAFQIVATLVAGVLFAGFFARHSLLGLRAKVPAPILGLASFAVASFVAYWWHRAMHASPLFWRVFHQLHHSPSRIESLTSFYMHPLDGIAATFINSFCAYFVFGGDAAVAAWGLLYAGLNNLYIHVDLRTPRWSGVVLQRPEMHRVHHQRNHHAQNYGLPIWDALFGTYANPKERVQLCGFEPDKESRIADMLRFKNVGA